MLANDPKGLQRRLDQAEALIEQERAKLKQLFEHIPLPAYNVSLEGLILDVNPTALDFLKIGNKQDLIGKTLLPTVYAPASRAKAKKLLETWKHSGSLRNEELQVQTADGEVRDVLLNADTILDQEGKAQYSISVHLDITERKRTEQALRREEERSRMYLDMAGVILMALDREGRVVLANPKACSVLEGDEADIIGKDWFASFIPEHGRTEVQRVFLQLMSGAVEPAEYFENQVVSLKGNIRWIAWHNTPVKSRDGAFLGTFSSGEDITERRQTAQALRESEERFRELTDSLPQVLFEVDTRGTITYANQRAFELFGYVEADLQRGLNTLEMIAAHDRERAEANILRVLQGEKPESTEYLALRKDASTFPVMIHSTRIVRDGEVVGLRGIIVDLSEHKAAECRLHPEVKPGGYVMIAVTDTGCGIDKKIQKQIFEPFFTTKAPGKGTGLGLATVFGTVKQSNGYVYVYSEPGTGSTFKIDLPVVQTRGSRDRRGPKEHTGYRTDRTILLVEDDEALRELVVRVLERIGYTVVSASSGEEALRLLDRSEHGDIDLLISDVIMPGIGGKVLAERLQARIPRLKVLYISGYPDETVMQHGVLDEGVAYLQKPFSPTAVIEKVQQILAED